MARFILYWHILRWYFCILSHFWIIYTYDLNRHATYLLVFFHNDLKNPQAVKLVFQRKFSDVCIAPVIFRISLVHSSIQSRILQTCTHVYGLEIQKCLKISRFSSLLSFSSQLGHHGQQVCTRSSFSYSFTSQDCLYSLPCMHVSPTFNDRS